MKYAYEFIFVDGKFISKILQSYCSKSNGFMLSFLPTSVIISPNYGSNIYMKTMVEVPYENMAQVGYVNPESGLHGHTIRVTCKDSSPSLKCANGIIKIYALIKEYTITMKIKQTSNMVVKSSMSVEGLYQGVTTSPFSDQESELITTIPRFWLSMNLQNIKAKTVFQFLYSGNSISFVINNAISTYPEHDNIDDNHTEVKTILYCIIETLKYSIARDKAGIVKALLVNGECWLTFMIGDWGQCMIKMGQNRYMLE